MAPSAPDPNITTIRKALVAWTIGLRPDMRKGEINAARSALDAVERELADLREKARLAAVVEEEADHYQALAEDAERRLREATDALRAAEGVLYALPRNAQSARRTEVLRIVRAALAAVEGTETKATIPTPPPIPARVVLGKNGAYWRDFGDGFYSMCPNSTDNDPVEPLAVFVYSGNITYRACGRCHGGGSIIKRPGGAETYACPDCKGSGTVRLAAVEGTVAEVKPWSCSDCGGDPEGSQWCNCADDDPPAEGTGRSRTTLGRHEHVRGDSCSRCSCFSWSFSPVAEGTAAVMPCGHPETAAVQAGEGTAYCGACAALTAGPAATTDPLPIESTAATPGEDETRWGQADGTSWPIPGDTEWRLRYAPDTANLLHAASIVSAYAFLVDPSRSQTDAIDSLKRGRRAVSAEPRETTT